MSAEEVESVRIHNHSEVFLQWRAQDMGLLLEGNVESRKGSSSLPYFLTLL